MSTTVKIVIGLVLAGAVALILIRRKQSTYTDGSLNTSAHGGVAGQSITQPTNYTAPVHTTQPPVGTGFSPPPRASIGSPLAPSGGPSVETRKGRGHF